MFMYLLIIGSVFFVYFDATKNKIGKVAGEKGFANMSAGMWAFCTALLWIVAFPLYLFKRGSLKEKALTNPVEVSGIKRKIILGLLVFSFLLTWVAPGIIAPNLAAYNAKGYQAALKSEMNMVVMMQHDYRATNGRYAVSMAELEYSPVSPDVKIEVVGVNQECFAIRGGHAGLTGYMEADCNGVR